MNTNSRYVGRNAFMAAASLAVSLIAFFGFQVTASAADRLLVMGTASPGGTYFPVGRALCSLINQDRDATGVRCLSYATGGSLYNLPALKTGELDFGITQSNLAFNAYHGLGEFAKYGPNKNLRVLADLYDQPLTVTVHKNSKIKDFSEILGSKINIGNKGSGKRTLADFMFKIMGWSGKDFVAVSEFSTGKQARAFCSGKIDVMIESVGIPTPLYDQVQKCGGKFLDLPEKLLNGFRDLGPFFFNYRIPRSINSNNERETLTIGMKIVLITRADVSATAIGSVYSSLFGDIGKFRKSHPALSLASESSLLAEGVDPPFHDAAKDFLRRRIDGAN